MRGPLPLAEPLATAPPPLGPWSEDRRLPFTTWVPEGTQRELEREEIAFASPASQPTHLPLSLLPPSLGRALAAGLRDSQRADARQAARGVLCHPPVLGASTAPAGGGAGSPLTPPQYQIHALPWE